MEKNNDLIERYLYAVSKHLPYRQKKDIINELRSIIDDMLDERCDDIVPSEKDVRVVLAELGTPEEIGVQYGLGKQKSLISGVYLIKYMAFLKIILLAVVLGFSLSTAINILVNNVSAVSGIFSLFGDIFSVGLSLIGAMTIVFVILERKSFDLKEFQSDTLPPVPKKKERISLVESVITIVATIVVTIIFLVSPQILAVGFTEFDDVIPVLNVDFIRNTWYIILLIGVVGVFDSVIKIVDGRYTKRVMIVSIITNCISIAGFLYIFNGNNIITDEFIDFAMKSDISISYINFFPFIIAVLILIDTATTIYRTLKVEKDNLQLS